VTPGPDVRQGGAWTPAQRAKNAAIVAGARVALALCRALPAGWLRGVGRAAGLLAYVLAWEARRTALSNLARVFPELPRRARRALARRAYRELGGHLGEAVAALSGAPLHPLRIAPAALDTFREAQELGRGVVFASAHLGPWERVAAGLVAEGIPLTTIARESYDPRLTPLYVRLRARSGVDAIHRGEPGAAARILRVLRRGGVLGVPMDLRSRVASVEAPFLGSPAVTAVGPARIALRTRTPVVVGSAAPAADGTLEVTASRIETADLPCTEPGICALTARINAELGARIRALPDQWVWMHPRWAP
jgi:Kdo2-lipid IVA lauroyltransferase/acyltransferase